MIMAGYEFMGARAVSHGVPARHGARHAASQDVQVARQRHRSARRREALRRRRAALDARSPAWAWAPTSSSIRTTSTSRSRRAATSPRSSGTSAASCSTDVGDDAGAAASARSIAKSLTRADEWILARLDAAIAECDARSARCVRRRRTTRPTRACGARRAVRRPAPQRVRRGGAPLRVERARRLVSRSGEGAARRRRAPIARSRARCSCTRSTRRCACCIPIVPFVTEALWQRLPGRDDERVSRATPPGRRGASADDVERGAREFELVREAVLAIRQIRGDNNVAPGKIDRGARASVEDGADARDVFEREARDDRPARARRRAARRRRRPPGAAAHAVLTGGTEVIVPLAGLIDVDKECARLRGEVAELEKQITSREGAVEQREVRRARAGATSWRTTARSSTR